MSADKLAATVRDRTEVLISAWSRLGSTDLARCLLRSSDASQQIPSRPANGRQPIWLPSRRQPPSFQEQMQYCRSILVGGLKCKRP